MMLRYLPIVLLIFAVSALGQSSSPATVPSLTVAQKQQLASTVDGPAFDQAGLYPLLTNVAQWHRDNLPAGTPLNFGVLLKNPAAHRGQITRIQGQYAGQSTRILLARSGPWGNAITRWGILTNRVKNQVVLVAFVDPHDQIKPPRSGRPVTVVGRFYEIWHTTDLNHNPAQFLIFVARSPMVEQGAAQQSVTATTIGLVVVVLAVIFVFLLRYLRRQRPISARQRWRDSAQRRDRDTLDESQDAADQPPLPEDPAEALEELTRRHKEKNES